MTENPIHPHTEHEEVKSVETRALIITSQLLQKKWLVIGVPVIVLAVAIIFIAISSSKKATLKNAANKYASATNSESLMEVYREYPNTPYGAYALAGVAKDSLAKGDYSMAIETSQEFLKEYSDNSLAVYVKRYIGVAHEEQGEFEEAIAAFREILEKDPRRDYLTDTLNIDIARCYEQLGDYDTARTYYEKAAPAPTSTAGGQSRSDGVWADEASMNLSRIKRAEKKNQAEKTRKEQLEEG